MYSGCTQKDLRDILEQYFHARGFLLEGNWGPAIPKNLLYSQLFSKNVIISNLLQSVMTVQDKVVLAALILPAFATYHIAQNIGGSG